MITSASTAERFRLLGFWRGLVVQEVFESLYCRDDSKSEHVKQVSDYVEGFPLAAAEVGLEVAGSSILPHLEKHDEFSEFILENTLLDKNLSSQVADQFGPVASFNFWFSQAIVDIRLLSAFRWSGRQKISAKRRRFVNKQRAIAHDALTFICDLLASSSKRIKDHLSGAINSQCRSIVESLQTCRRSAKRFELANVLTEKLINDLFPDSFANSRTRTEA